MRQEFLCEECGVESHVELARGHDEDALYVFEEIAREHAKWSPECNALTNRIKILKGLITSGEWPHTVTAGVLN